MNKKVIIIITIIIMKIDTSRGEGGGDEEARIDSFSRSSNKTFVPTSHQNRLVFLTKWPKAVGPKFPLLP